MGWARHVLNAIPKPDPKDNLSSSWATSCRRSLECPAKGVSNGVSNGPALTGKALGFRKDARLQAMA